MTVNRNWRLLASCATPENRTLFDKVAETGLGDSRHGLQARSKEVCNNCPVINECLADALETHEFGKMFGAFRAGLTAREQRALLRRQRRKVV